MSPQASTNPINTDSEHSVVTSTSDQLLIDRWQDVQDRLAQAKQAHQVQDSCDDQGDSQVSLVAVSKTKPAEMVATLAKCGQQHFGENYLQEALEKIQQLQGLGIPITWHYIGHIQRNKTRDIAENFDWVQTIDRQIIAKRLNNQRPDSLPALNVLIQVNIDHEKSKSGCSADELAELVAAIKTFPRLQLRGLMIIPAKANAGAFDRIKQLFDEIKTMHPDLDQWDTLSMGMSEDMKDAVLAGSTMVRVGSAIFGARD